MEISAISMQPIGVVHSTRTSLDDYDWGSVVANIELDAAFPIEALDGIDGFSHAEIIFHLDRIAPSRIVTGARRPRDNPDWPRIGIFAQRGAVRPNRMGATIVRVLGRDGRSLRVQGLDAVDGTPVLDIKPVMSEFLPREAVRQPEWSRDVMRNYW